MIMSPRLMFQGEIPYGFDAMSLEQRLLCSSHLIIRHRGEVFMAPSRDPVSCFLFVRDVVLVIPKQMREILSGVKIHMELVELWSYAHGDVKTWMNWDKITVVSPHDSVFDKNVVFEDEIYPSSVAEPQPKITPHQKMAENETEDALKMVLSAGLGTVLENQAALLKLLVSLEGSTVDDLAREMLRDQAEVHVLKKDKRLVRTRIQKAGSKVAEEIRSRASLPGLLSTVQEGAT